MASTSVVANRLGAKQAFGSSSGLKPAARSGALARARIVVRAEKSQVRCGLQRARRPAVGLCIWSYLFSQPWVLSLAAHRALRTWSARVKLEQSQELAAQQWRHCLMFLVQRFARSASLRAPVLKSSLVTLLAARGCWSALRVLESGCCVAVLPTTCPYITWCLLHIVACQRAWCLDISTVFGHIHFVQLAECMLLVCCAGGAAHQWRPLHWVRHPSAKKN